jgi:hypothetical protein
MRRILYLIAIGLSAASVAACQNGSSQAQATAGASQAPALAAADSSPAQASGSPAPRTNPETPGAEASPSTNSSEPAAEKCGADKLARFLNLLPTEPVKREIAQTAGTSSIRYIAPGDVVTMDFRPDRLDVETGVDGRIKRFRCG